MTVLAQWHLDGASVRPIDSGATNETWRVDHTGGTHFLRKYRSTDRDAVRHEHDLIRRAADAGVSTPRPIHALAGDTVVESEGALYALFEAAVGQQLGPAQLTPTHAATAGAFLADLHAAIADAPVAAFRPVTLDWEGAGWADRVRATAALIPRDLPNDADRWAYQRSMEQAAWLDHPDCRHRYTPSSPVQVIHGDYQHANLFFAGTKLSSVIDWDTAAVTCRAYEIVRACAFMFALEPDRTAAFIAAYRTVTNLSAPELRDGAQAWGCFSDHHVWAVEERYRSGNRAAERFIPRRPFAPFEHTWRALGLT